MDNGEAVNQVTTAFFPNCMHCQIKELILSDIVSITLAGTLDSVLS